MRVVGASLLLVTLSVTPRRFNLTGPGAGKPLVRGQRHRLRMRNENLVIEILPYIRFRFLVNTSGREVHWVRTIPIQVDTLS